jgi:RimJ/RimL family protein N-acetyltransferase
LVRFLVEPNLIGPNWSGFRDVGGLRRRFDTDGWLGADDGWLMVTLEAEPVGFVTWSTSGSAAGRYRSIGAVLLPEHRGKEIGSRARYSLCEYLFTHYPIQRIEATTQPDNQAEQRSLSRIGFRHEGTLRSADFRTGDWQDVMVYGLLRGELTGT